MRNVKLYIACSLDGYIAGPDGNLDWLIHDTTDYGYDEFYSSVDVTLSGYKTYELTLTFDKFPYPGKANYVFTRNHVNEKHPEVQFLNTDIKEFVHRLKNENGKDIWLIGGGELIREFIRLDLIDEYIIFRTASLIGEGIPLFPPFKKQVLLDLIDSKTYPSGMTKSVYVPKR